MPSDLDSHSSFEPQTCPDPCFEMNQRIIELEDALAFARWRNEQANDLLDRAIQFFGDS